MSAPEPVDDAFTAGSGIAAGGAVALPCLPADETPADSCRRTVGGGDD